MRLAGTFQEGVVVAYAVHTSLSCSRMPPQHMGGGGMAGPQMMQQHGGQDQRSGFGGGMAGPGGVPGCSPGGGGSGVPGGPQGMAAIFSLGQSAIGAPVHVILVQQVGVPSFSGRGAAQGAAACHPTQICDAVSVASCVCWALQDLPPGCLAYQCAALER